jgi:hypothetical protein
MLSTFTLRELVAAAALAASCCSVERVAADLIRHENVPIAIAAHDRPDSQEPQPIGKAVLYAPPKPD